MSKRTGFNQTFGQVLQDHLEATRDLLHVLEHQKDFMNDSQRLLVDQELNCLRACETQMKNAIEAYNRRQGNKS